MNNSNFLLSIYHIKKTHVKDDSVKSSLCCLQGCIAASSVGFSFFVALPTGILLIVYSQKDSDYRLLSAGIVLVILPVVVLLIVIALCFNKHRLKRFGRNRIKHGRAATITADNGIEETNYGKY
ncbi:uncharacterized protein LOC126827979 [Patella vulgata]|uniref:uncharacterized protein LOC126827979 n=1 Tax=Patella vulgata TaxID=6465 RepID=UPI0024A85903|nr:uncharacterized protein LOC126827979 [Patella vulgata]